jgi:hypothetical protein
MIESIPNPVPTSGEIRIARIGLAEALAASAGWMRTPVIAGVGTADLVVDSIGAEFDRGLDVARELTERLSDLARRAA